MSNPTWICTNSPWHEWGNGLTCRWCDATRTAGEAIVSGLASRRGGSKDAAQDLLDAYRAEILAEAADHFEQRRLTREAAVSDFDRGRRATVGWVVEELREKATTSAATATPDFFQKGRTYTSTDRTGLHLRFVCEHITRDPKDGVREAWGWLHRSNGTRRMERQRDADYPKWTVEGGDGRG